LKDRVVTLDAGVTDFSALFHLIRTGDQAACVVLTRLVRMKLLAELSRALADDAEDVLQETMAQLFEDIAQNKIRDPERVLIYAKRIATGIKARIFRARAIAVKKLVSIDEAPVLKMAATHERELIERQRYELVLKALTTIPEFDGDLIRRAYFLGETAEQIQAELELSRDAYYKALERARVRLRQRYFELEGSPLAMAA